MYIDKILTTLLLPGIYFVQAQTSEETAAARTFDAVNEIASRSFPEIKRHKLRVKIFQSDNSFFKARYSLVRFLTFQRMRHLVYVNPDAFERGITEEAFRAILAHELAHVAYYTRKNRLQLIGLVRLAGASARIDFERKADLDAILRGYGRGLIEYREWLYKQLSPAEVQKKKKTYFSPAEIRLVIKAVAEQPRLIEKWRKKIPGSIEEIKRDTGYG